MKKFLVVTIGIVLIAAACNKQAAVQPAQNQTSQNSQQTNQSSQIDMSSWKTYSNAKLGFEMQYDPNFSIIEDPTKFPAGSEADTQVMLVQQNADGTDNATIAIKKIHSSMHDAVANQFGATLGDISFSGLGKTNAYVATYQTASLDESKTYLFPKAGPTSPADPETTPTDIIVATVSAGITDASVKVTAADSMLNTLIFTK